VFLDENSEEPAGRVTSGTRLPTLGKAMGMVYLPTGAAQVGLEFFVDIRGRTARARVVELPFYSRKKDQKSG
jgi:aminomethyltransferase